MRFKKTSEPNKLPAGLLAILVHLAFFALLVFGVTWQTKSPAPVSVDIWSSLPAPAKAPAKEPPTESKPPPEPAPKPEPTPKPKAEPVPTPKPDIALKQEKLKREQEKKKLENEKRKEKEEEQKKQKQEDERKKQEKVKEEQAKKLAAQKEAQAKAKTQAQADQAAKSAAEAKVNDYIARIQAKIKSNTIIPPDVVGNPQVVYEITLLPTGEVLDVRLIKGSGFPSYDAAAERAIRKSAPLPIPKDDPALFASKFRVGNYAFRPND
ncbi:MAG: TonB C-terminal domain-containing protein [Burkholderiales bacterium]|nr:TonB C-terminal domain-containing protein [Burkholderiales bacterium]